MSQNLRWALAAHRIRPVPALGERRILGWGHRQCRRVPHSLLGGARPLEGTGEQALAQQSVQGEAPGERCEETPALPSPRPSSLRSHPGPLGRRGGEKK